MSNQQLKDQYNRIEAERKVIKEQWCSLKNSKGDKETIKELGKKLTALTLNQAHILIDLEKD